MYHFNILLIHRTIWAYFISWDTLVHVLYLLTRKSHHHLKKQASEINRQSSHALAAIFHLLKVMPSQVIDHIEIWSLWWNKMWFLPSYCCVHTTICMHHLNFNKVSMEKKVDGNNTRMLPAVFENHGSSTLQNSSSTATYLPSHKPSKKDEQDMLEK